MNLYESAIAKAEQKKRELAAHEERQRQHELQIRALNEQNFNALVASLKTLDGGALKNGDELVVKSNSEDNTAYIRTKGDTIRIDLACMGGNVILTHWTRPAHGMLLSLQSEWYQTGAKSFTVAEAEVHIVNSLVDLI